MSGRRGGGTLGKPEDSGWEDWGTLGNIREDKGNHQGTKPTLVFDLIRSLTNFRLFVSDDSPETQNYKVGLPWDSNHH